jgi:hypothetical protein
MAVGSMLGRMLVPAAVALVFGLARRYMPVRPRTEKYLADAEGQTLS